MTSQQEVMQVIEKYSSHECFEPIFNAFVRILMHVFEIDEGVAYNFASATAVAFVASFVESGQDIHFYTNKLIDLANNPSVFILKNANNLGIARRNFHKALNYINGSISFLAKFAAKEIGYDGFTELPTQGTDQT